MGRRLGIKILWLWMWWRLLARLRSYIEVFWSELARTKMKMRKMMTSVLVLPLAGSVSRGRWCSWWWPWGRRWRWWPPCLSPPWWEAWPGCTQRQAAPSFSDAFVPHCIPDDDDHDDDDDEDEDDYDDGNHGGHDDDNSPVQGCAPRLSGTPDLALPWCVGSFDKTLLFCYVMCRPLW